MSACVSSPNSAMPPERRRPMKPGRKTGTKPDRRTRTKAAGTAGPRTGGPPLKAAPSSQPKAPARPSAVAAAMAVAAEEDERLLRQRNRLTLEEDKPDVERCLEEFIFGDVEDDEDALLRRLRGPPVREAARAGRAVGGEAPGAEPGRPAAAGREGVPGGGSGSGSARRIGRVPRWASSLRRVGVMHAGFGAGFCASWPLQLAQG